MGTNNSILQPGHRGPYRNFTFQTHWFLRGHRGPSTRITGVSVAIDTKLLAKESLIAWLVFQRAVITAWCNIMNTWLVCQEHQWYSKSDYISTNLQLEAVGRLPIYLPCVFVRFVTSCMERCSVNRFAAVMWNRMCFQKLGAWMWKSRTW